MTRRLAGHRCAARSAPRDDSREASLSALASPLAQARSSADGKQRIRPAHAAPRGSASPHRTRPLHGRRPAARLRARRHAAQPASARADPFDRRRRRARAARRAGGAHRRRGGNGRARVHPRPDEHPRAAEHAEHQPHHPRPGAPPARPRSRPLRRRDRRCGHRRDRCDRARRGRADHDRLRTASRRHRDRDDRDAGRAARLGRGGGKHLLPLRGGRSRRRRCGVRARAPHGPVRDGEQPRACRRAGDARRDRRIRSCGRQVHPHHRQPDAARAEAGARRGRAACRRPERVRVLVADVGGSFGIKNVLYPEQAIVLWAARRIGRPVAWIGERADGFVSDYQARDNVSTRGAGARRGRATSSRSGCARSPISAPISRRAAIIRRRSTRPRSPASIACRRSMSRWTRCSATPRRSRCIAAPAGRKRCT